MRSTGIAVRIRPLLCYHRKHSTSTDERSHEDVGHPTVGRLDPCKQPLPRPKGQVTQFGEIAWCEPVAEDCLKVSPVLPRVLAQGAHTPPGRLMLQNLRCELLIAERCKLVDP